MRTRIESLYRSGSNEYLQSMFRAEIYKKKKKSEFLSDFLQFLEVKFSIYLNRCVFIMMCNIDVLLYIYDQCQKSYYRRDLTLKVYASIPKELVEVECNGSFTNWLSSLR